MKNRFGFTLLLIAGLLLGTTSSVAQSTGAGAAPAATPLSTAFTYQGRLDRDGQPYTGSCDFQFRLWDAATDGLAVGSVIPLDDLPVSDGLFTAELDFGSGAFNGEARWLAVSVQCPGDVSPTSFARQALTAAPYALYAAAAPWSGLTDKPAGLDDGDDDTSYSAGDGLTLSTTAFSIDPNYTQRRVPGSCAAGSTIRAIHADGSVECRTGVPGLQGYYRSAIDTIGDVGIDPALVIGEDGLGLISYCDYYSFTDSHLKVAHCNDVACTSASTATIDSNGAVCGSSSITIAADGLGLISYNDKTNADLMVAHCNDVYCSSATSYRLDSSGEVGAPTSIYINNNGMGVILYHDFTNKDLKSAVCNNIACSSATPATLDSAGTVGEHISVTLGADGLGLISYFDDTNTDLKVGHCNDQSCSSISATLVDTAGGYWTSTTTGYDGLGLISYVTTSYHLKVVHCNTPACNAFSITTLDTGGGVGDSAITIGADGLGLISYFDWNTNSTIVIHCSDALCSKGTKHTLSSSTPVNLYFSMTTGTDGMGLISYYDATNKDLVVAHCSNHFCIPYYRQR